MKELSMRFGATAVKRALISGIIGALLTGFMVAQAVTSTDLGSSSVKLVTESFTDDTAVIVTALGTGIAGSTGGAVGGTSPGVEAVGPTLGVVNSALTQGNYAYKIEVKEAAAGSWAASQNYKIEVYETTGSTTTLLATLYTQQGTADAGSVEGVTATVDVGSATTVPDSFDVIVTRQ